MAHIQDSSRGRTSTLSGFRLILLLSTLAAFAPFSTDMYLAAFPAMAATFHTDAGAVQATLSVFVFGLAAGQLLYGPLIDRFGRRRPLRLGIALFAMASLGLCMAPTIGVFTALRLLQALGGCAGMIICRAVISDLFDEREALDKNSIVMMVASLAPIVAPIAGGADRDLAGLASHLHVLGGFRPAVSALGESISA